MLQAENLGIKPAIFAYSNTDLLQLCTLLNKMDLESRYKFLIDILPGMYIESSCGIAGCFGSGRFGERNENLTKADYTGKGKLYSKPENMGWNIIGTKLIIDHNDEYLW
ncbi:MAG: hypothetical protein JXJ04_05240 [Spirochaetales bacterium]|nr:hypothetical protein [Spirochaetales bacterium]